MTLPAWLEPLPDAAAMRATDAWAIETRGVPSLDLMERAGTAVAGHVARAVPEGPVAVVCGKGNNGGDGYVVARLLRDAGRDVTVVALWDPGELRGDARAEADRLTGDPPVPFAPEALRGAAAIVDAMLGTGFAGEVREPVLGAIRAVNDAGGRVIAVDVPSGVDASTGEVAGEAVRADATVTFHRAKPGLWISPGKQHAGSVHVADIGIPDGAPVESTAGLVGDAVLDELPRRGAASTKFTSGNVYVVGGSSGLTGAPVLAALAAQRAGAGYVTVAAPASIELSLAVRLLEAMVRPLPEEDGKLGPSALAALLEALERANAVVLGPGLGRAPEAQAFAREAVERSPLPLVVDADGLNALVGHLEVVRRRTAPTVLTPHAGELGRLLDVGSDEIGRRRLHHARAAAEATGAVVVLKGDDTLVAAPGGRVAVSRGDAPALATAGTGDVLAGVIAALVARGLPAERAAAAGVHGHVRAGQIAAAPHGPDGVVAGDVISALPAALAGAR